MRRAWRFMLGCCRVVLAIASVAIVGTWAVSLLLTDRLGWSQYIWWVPTAAWAIAGVVTLGAWWLLAAWRRGTDGRPISTRARRGGSWARRVLMGLMVIMLVHASVIEWRLHRWVKPVRTSERGIRIANWNPAVPVETLQGPIMELDADIIAIVNQPGAGDVDDLAAAMGEDWEVFRSFRLSVITRLPVKRWGFTGLGLKGRVMSSWRFRELDVSMTEQSDGGRAFFIEVGAGDDTLVVWVVDLPSDVTLARRDVMADAAKALAEFQGDEHFFNEQGQRERHPIEGGFPEPDVIMGDFNAIRGSWSLSQLVGDRVNAFDAAGRGWGGTFPIQMPIAQIDQMFVGPRWKTADYRIFDPGGGFHLAQVGTVVPVRE